MIERRAFLAGAAALSLSGCTSTVKPFDPIEVRAAYPPIGRFVRVEGLDVHYWEKGTGQPVVLVHGASGNLRDWTFDVAERLARRHRVIVFDRPGFGYSGRPSENGWDPAVQARILQAASARIGAERPVVVGHSWGGALAMAWGLDFPAETSGVIPVSGVTMPYGNLAWAVNAIGLSDILVDWYSERLLERARDGGVRDFIARVFRPQPVPEGYIDYIGAPLALRESTLRANAEDLNNINIALERMADLLQNRTAIPVVDVPIDELPGEAAAELASGLLAASGVDSPPLAALIAEESRGNPYFLRELAGADVDDLGNARLEDLIIKRFRALPQEARRFLEIVSVASRPVLRCDLAEAADLPGREQKMESILRAAYFIKSSGAGWKDQIETFHDRIRETIRGALDPGILRERHWSLATALECSPEIDHEALAFHFQGAEVFEKAGTYYARAAEDAAEILAFDRAAQLYRQSLRTFPRPETEQAKLRVRLGEVLALAGRGFEAGETYQLAARDSDDAARSELEWRAAFQFLVTGHLDEARVGLENLMRRVGLRMHRSALTALARC